MSSNFINEKNTYLISGAPLPSNISTILNNHFNSSFINVFNSISILYSIKGYALIGINKDITTIVTINLPSGMLVLAMILDSISNIKYNLVFGRDERIQTTALVWVFVKARSKAADTD